MKFLIVQLPPFSRHLIPLRSKYSSQNPVLKHPITCMNARFYHLALLWAKMSNCLWIVVFYIVTPYSLASGKQSFEGNYRHHLQGETVTTYKTTQYHSPLGHNLRSHRREIINSLSYLLLLERWRPITR
jgi:hypothetical protein